MRLQSLEKLAKSGFPEPMRKQRHAHLVRSIRSMAKVFAEKFLSHNRDEVLANFGPLLSFQSSTETMNANDIHEGLRGIVGTLEEGSPARAEAEKVLERFEKEIEEYFDRLSDFLFVARVGGKPQTAKMLVYVTKPYEFDMAEAHLETMVSSSAYDSFSKLRRLLYPKGIPHSVPRSTKPSLKERDFPSLIRYFKNGAAWDRNKKFKTHPALPMVAEKLERAYFDGDGKGIEALTAEEELLRTIFRKRSTSVRDEALELARLIREYVGKSAKA